MLSVWWWIFVFNAIDRLIDIHGTLVLDNKPHHTNRKHAFCICNCSMFWDLMHIHYRKCANILRGGENLLQNFAVKYCTRCFVARSRIGRGKYKFVQVVHYIFMEPWMSDGHWMNSLVLRIIFWSFLNIRLNLASWTSSSSTNVNNKIHDHIQCPRGGRRSLLANPMHQRKLLNLRQYSISNHT